MNEDSGGGFAGEAHARSRASPPPPALTAEEEAALLAEYGVEGPYDDGIDWAAPSQFRSGLGDGHVFLTGADDAAVAAGHDAHAAALNGAGGVGAGVRYTDPLQLYLLDHVPSLMLPERGTSIAAMTALAHAVDALEGESAAAASAAVAGPTPAGPSTGQGSASSFADVLRLGKEWVRRASLTAQGVPAASLAAHLLASDSSAPTCTSEVTAAMPAEVAESTRRSDNAEYRRLLENTQRLLVKAAEVLTPPASEQHHTQAAEVTRAVAELQQREALLSEDALDQHYDREEVLHAEEEDEEVLRLLRQAREGRRRLCAALADRSGFESGVSEVVARTAAESKAPTEAEHDDVTDDLLQAVMPALPYLCAFETEPPHAPAQAPTSLPTSPTKEEPAMVAAEEQLPTLTLPSTTRIASAKTAVEAWQTSDPLPQLLVETQHVLASIANTQLRDAAAEKTAAASRAAYLHVRRPVSAVVNKAAHAPLRHGDRGALGLVALPTFVHQLDVLLSPTREEQQHRHRRDSAERSETTTDKPAGGDGSLRNGEAASARARQPIEKATAAAAAAPLTLEQIRRKAAIESLLIEREAAERQRMHAEEELVEREARAAADLAVWHAEQRAELEQTARDGVARLEETQRAAFAELAKAAQRDKALAQQAQELRRLQETERLAYTLMMEWEVQREQLAQDEALRFRVLLRDAAAEAERAQAAAQERRDRAVAAKRAVVDAVRGAFEQERRRGTSLEDVAAQEVTVNGDALRASSWFTWCVAPLLREQTVLREWVAANRKRLAHAREQLAEAAAFHVAHVVRASSDGRAEDGEGGAAVTAAPPVELPAHPPLALDAAAPLSGLRVLDAKAFVRLLWPALHAAVVDARHAARHLARVTLSLEDFQGVDWAQLRGMRLRTSGAAEAHRLPRTASKPPSILSLSRLVEDLDLSGNPLQEVGLLDAVDAFRALRCLDLSRTELHALDAAAPSPNSFVQRQRRISSGDRPSSSHSSHLRHISAARHNAVAARLHLVSLNVASNRLTSLAPLGTVAAASLVRCVATDNRLSSLDAVAGCLQLRELLVSHNNLTSLGAAAGLPLLRELDAGNNALTSVLPATPVDAKPGAPAPLLLLLTDKLFVSHNPLPALPEGRCIFPCLTQLFVNHAQLTALDDAALAWMPLLTVLQAEGNRIADISGLCHCTRLQSLRLSSNRLATLQALEPLRCCRRLTVLDVSGNPCCGGSGSSNTTTNDTASDGVLAAAVYALVPSLTELNNAPRAACPAAPPAERHPWRGDTLRIVTPEVYRDVVSTLCWDAAVQQMLEDKGQREAYAQRPVNRARGWEMTAQAKAADAQAVAEDSGKGAAARLNDVAAAQMHVRRAEHDRRAALYEIDASLVAAWGAAGDGGAVLANVHVRHVSYAQHEQDHLERLARAWISEWLLGRVCIRRARRELQARRAAYEQSEGRRRERAARRIQPVWRGAALRSRLRRLLHPARDKDNAEDDDDDYAKVNVDDWLTEDPAALAPVELLLHDVVDSARGLAAVPFDVPASALVLSSGGGGGNAAAASSSRGGMPATSGTFTPVPPRTSGSPRGSASPSGRRVLAAGALSTSSPPSSSGGREEEARTPASEAATLEEQWGPRVAAQIRKKQQKSTRSHQQHMRQEFLQDPLRVKREMREDRVQHRPNYPPIGKLYPISSSRDRREGGGAASPAFAPQPSPTRRSPPAGAPPPLQDTPTAARAALHHAATPVTNRSANGIGAAAASPAATQAGGFPVQRRNNGLALSRPSEALNGFGDGVGDGDAAAGAAVAGSEQRPASAPPTSASASVTLSLRRLGLRLVLCGKCISQCLAAVSGGVGGRSGRHSSDGAASPRMRAHRSRAGHDGRADPRAVRRIRPLDESVAAAYRTNLVVNSRYTPRNFIFKNLYEQFSRPLNFYFLLVAMLQFISVIAPVNPLSTLLPLLFAFTLTAVKEGYDDVKRHRQDHAYNHARRTVLDGETGDWVSRINADICVGDVLVLRGEEELPCDVVVLGATGGVYIRTDNLDGEIDLKPKEVVQWSTADADGLSRHRHTVCQVPSETELPPASSIAAAVAGLVVECPPPSAMVDSFEGRVDLQRPAAREGGAATAVRVPLSHHHLLPQSCVLKNVAQVVCVAVYTGDDTKCGMNKREAPVKWARIDKDVSRYSVYIFACQMLNAFIFGFIGYTANRNVHETVWYLPQPTSEASASAAIYPLRFFLLTTVMIPVSFKFVVDVCKYYMASTVEWDETMMHAIAPVAGAAVHGDAPTPGCKVKNSSILEDLGQIDYLLSDKTGTLTQNVMELDSVTVCPGFHLHVGGQLAATAAPLLPDELVTRDPAAPEAVRRFATMVALCNTVEVVRPHRTAVDNTTCHEPGGGLLYHAASPDEVALCTGVRRLGVSLTFRDESRAVLRVHGDQGSSRRDNADRSGGARSPAAAQEETWAVHYTFHFSSEKKSMGVIVEEPETGRIWFVVKGADDRVLAMASRGPHDAGAALNAECAAKLSHYAHRGLRTLLVASKELTRSELTAFLRSAEEASCLTEGRQARLDGLRAQMESAVTILGITAIEDKLQVDVQETISDMLVAGIKVWMLTGDKMETAEQIGLSCGLYNSRDMVIRVGEGLSVLTERNSADRPHGTAAGPQDWRQELLNLPMERLPVPAAAAPPPPPPQPHSGQGTRCSTPSAGAFPSTAAAQACGKALENRVLRYDPGDPAQLSNEVLRTLGDAAEADSTGDTASHGSPTSAGAFTSGLAERGAVLVVQGGAVLESILHDPTLRRRFADVSSRCCSVICARTTPSQKAAITQFVRQRGFTTLSVGDGGNDVAMLQEAHVGVGIAGKEGQQAARAADFSITQFSDLRALLFVHGQQAYARTAYVIKYSFYKSMLISFIQLAYNVVGTHASGGTFWNSFSLTMWNGFYTLPQTIFYCFDRCAPRVVLERNPHLYKLTRHAVDIRAGEFFGSFVLRGVVQSIGLLWLCTGIYGAPFAYAGTGGAASNDVTFSVAYTALMLSQLYTVWWESHSVTPLNLLMLLGMPLFYVYSTLAYSARPALQYYGVFPRSLDVAGVLAALGVSLALTVPSLLYFTALATREPNPRDGLRRAELRRQRLLLGRRDYRHTQSWWVRWCGATPEAPSMLVARGQLHRFAEREDAGGIV